MKNKKKANLMLKLFLNFVLKVVITTIALPSSYIIIAQLLLEFDFNWLYRLSPDFYFTLRDVFAFFYGGMAYVIVFLIWAIIILIFLYKMLKKTFVYINSLTEAIDKLYDKETEYISLPEEFEDIENKLNTSKLESERNERLARENEQKKDELIVYLAHDIKTPLTSMIGYLSILDEIDDMPKKKQKKYISVALDKSYRLEELINELFDIARFNSEKIILEKEEISLNLMLEQIIDDFYPLLNELGKKIVFTSSEEIKIMADSDKLGRVFSNLVKNAISYSKDESNIKINAQSTEENVLIDIINKGKMIPPEKLERIFEKFYRLDSSRTSKTGGSGLGLAIAKDIIELHKGKITASSNEKETIFHVELPWK